MTKKAGHVELMNAVAQRCFCLHSRMTARTVTRRYNAVLAPVGLEVTRFSLLVALSTGTQSSISELADQLAFERTTLVRNLKSMANEGLIIAAPGRGRAVHYRLTDRGNSLLAKALPLWTKVQASVELALAAEAAHSPLASLQALRRTTAKLG